MRRFLSQRDPREGLTLAAGWVIVVLVVGAAFAVSRWAEAQPFPVVALVLPEDADGGCDVVHEWDTGCEP